MSDNDNKKLTRRNLRVTEDQIQWMNKNGGSPLLRELIEQAMREGLSLQDESELKRKNFYLNEKQVKWIYDNGGGAMVRYIIDRARGVAK